jgi:hypothetical protein
MTENVHPETRVTQASDIDPDNVTMTLNAINKLEDVTRQQQSISSESNQVRLQQEAWKLNYF